MACPNEKEVEYYAAQANAWFNTKLEYDKSLLILSAGAIGLLITLLTTVGVENVTLLFLFGVAILSFIVCLGTVLAIFLRNAKHLESLIAGNASNDQLLRFFDLTSIFSFALGVILTAIIGMATATNQVLLKGALMSNKRDTQQSNVPLRESFDGASNVAPQTGDTLKKSFDGANNVAPPKETGSGGSSAGSGSSGQGTGSSGNSGKQN